MKYKCNDCEHVFEGSSYTTECLECESSDFSAFTSNDGTSLDKPKDWVKNNKLIAAVIAVMLVLMIWPLCNPCEDLNNNGVCDNKESNTVYSLSFERSNSNFCKVYLLDEDKKPIPFGPEYGFLNLRATITSDSDDYQVILKGNKIEYCTEGNLVIEYIKNSPRLTGYYKSGIKSWEVEPPNPNLGGCIKAGKIIDVSIALGPACKNKIVITTSGSEILVSVNGQNGVYKNQKTFDPPNNKADFSVWYHPKGHPTSKTEYDGVLPRLVDSQSPLASQNDKSKFKNKVARLLTEVLEEYNKQSPDIIKLLDLVDVYENAVAGEPKVIVRGVACPDDEFTSKLITMEFRKPLKVEVDNIIINNCEPLRIEKINIE